MSNLKTIIITVLLFAFAIGLFLGVAWLVATVGTGLADLIFKMSSQEEQAMFRVLFMLTMLLELLSKPTVKITVKR